MQGQCPISVKMFTKGLLGARAMQRNKACTGPGQSTEELGQVVRRKALLPMSRLGLGPRSPPQELHSQCGSAFSKDTAVSDHRRLGFPPLRWQRQMAAIAAAERCST